MVQAGDGSVIDRRCFSTWLEPVLSECSYESLWAATREIHLISSNRSTPSSSTDAESHEADGIDPWEKTFGLNWLTRLLAFTIRRTSSVSGDDDHDWESLSSLVGQVMAQMTGSPDCPAKSFVQRYRFDISCQGMASEESNHQTATAVNSQVEVEIREGSLSFSAIGSQTWNSAPLLCRRLCREPYEFFPQLRRRPIVDHCPTNPALPCTEMRGTNRSLKVLELGSGTGLVGLTASQILASLLSSLPSLQPIDVQVILTDYHPDVLDNLEHNLALNQSRHTLPEGCPSTLSVKVMKLDWRDPELSELATNGVAGAFDVVLGSDLVYEPEHAVWASNAVRYFLKSETSRMEIKSLEPMSVSSASVREDYLDVQPSFHLLLPLRPTFTKESEAVHQVFGGSDMNLLLDQTDQVAGALPTHSCEWELLANQQRAKKLRPSTANTTTATHRPFKITKYSKEEGVQFGQGCGEYQYLLITWADYQ